MRWFEEGWCVVDTAETEETECRLSGCVSSFLNVHFSSHFIGIICTLKD